MNDSIDIGFRTLKPNTHNNPIRSFYSDQLGGNYKEDYCNLLSESCYLTKCLKGSIDVKNKDFSSYISWFVNDVNYLLKETWNPSNDPDFYADQQCADTVIRLLANFCEKQGYDFGVYITSGKFIKMSDFPNSIEFCKYVFPKFSASLFYTGINQKIFKPITSSSDNSGLNLSLLQAGDICSIKYEGGHHAFVLANKPNSIHDVIGLAGNRLYRDISKERRINEKSPHIGNELKENPKKVFKKKKKRIK